MGTLDHLEKHIRAQNANPRCPHCDGEINMSDCEFYQHHTTYWGDDEPKEEECPHCERSFFLCEHVTRSWTAGETSEKARWPDA